jgi:GDP-4-dehydro-6-deoxy-D-mannose reductase
MRVLITGYTGFVGSHLCRLLQGEHPEVTVFGLQRWRTASEPSGAPPAGVEVLEGNLLDPSSLQRAVATARPEVVFHLAASSSVASSWSTPAEMLQVNALGTLHLLEAVRQVGGDPVIVLACSAEPYGQVAENALPIREEQPFHPVSPYAVSKAVADMLGFQYHLTFGMRIIRLRLFNHCGPGQSSRFVVSSLARQVADAEAGRCSEVRVGNVEVRRDFIDVRDVARAYWLAATRGEAGAAYNVASGVVHSIREVLDTLLDLSGLSVPVVFDPAQRRPTDISVLHGDPGRFYVTVGWRPEIPFRTTLADTVEWWRCAARS